MDWLDLLAVQGTLIKRVFSRSHSKWESQYFNQDLPAVSTVPCSMYLANHSSVFLYLSLQTFYNWELSHHHYSLTNIKLQIIQNPFHFTLLTYLTGIQKTHMIWYRKILTFTPSITWFSCCSALWSSSSEEKWIQPIPLWKPVSLSLKIQNLGRNNHELEKVSRCSKLNQLFHLLKWNTRQFKSIKNPALIQILLFPQSLISILTCSLKHEQSAFCGVRDKNHTSSNSQGKFC